MGDPSHSHLEDAAELEQEFASLREILAENVHNTWARQRTSEGWGYGPKRDDHAKKHPGLVAYNQLPESEKEYDRKTAMETLRAVLNHGYRILPPAQSAELGPNASPLSPHSQTLDELLSSGRSLDVRGLVAHQKSVALRDRWDDVVIARKLVRRLLEFNEPLLAFDFVSEALQFFPNDLCLRQLKGLSLARSGAALKANQIFAELRDAGGADEETLGNLARTYKSLWESAQSPAQKQKYLNLAYEAYQRSYQSTRGYWSGINVSFLALMRGDVATAHRIATEVRAHCLKTLQTTAETEGEAYWLTATIAEAALIQANVDEASEWYARASVLAGKRMGNIASTCRQARALANFLGLPWPELSRCFPLPPVLVFSADPGPAWLASTADQRMTLEADARQAFQDYLQSHKQVIGFAAIHHWLDIVFLEAVVQHGGEICILLSTDEEGAEEVLADELATRKQQLLAQCRELHAVTAREYEGGALAESYSENVLIGLAGMRARQFGSEPILLGFPSHCLPQFGQKPLQLAELDLTARVPQASDHEAVEDPANRPHAEGSIVSSKPKLMALLFADVKGFSRLRESQLIRFAREFLGRVSNRLHSLDVQPVTRHTWGDGLFFTFDHIRDAGMFALDLAETVESIRWQDFGLPSDLSMRIGLHAGPVYECFDPVSEQTTFFGIHVNHAARIEPITPPGNVYASEAFAALASQQNISNFHCEYVGRTALAKDFGMFSTYHVRYWTSP